MKNYYFNIITIIIICIIFIPNVISKATPTNKPTSSPTYNNSIGEGRGLHGCNKKEHGFYSSVSISCLDKNAKYSDTDTSIPTMLIKTKSLINYNIVDQVLVDDDNNEYFNVSIKAYPDPIPESILVQDSSSIDYVNKLIGIALDGIPMYTAMLEPGIDALEPANGKSVYKIDYCGGTYGETPNGLIYHYRTIPSCVRNLNDPTQQIIFDNVAKSKRQKYIKDIHELLEAFEDLSNPIILGYSLNGYPIYSPFDSNGILQTNLDNCNGKFINGSNYGYYVTPTFPYIIGCDGPGIYNINELKNTIESLPEVVKSPKYNSCPQGSYFDGSKNGCYKCPAGKYSTASYSRESVKGSAFTIAGGTCNQICPIGHFCPEGSIKPIKCEGGKYGAISGQTSKECSGPCKPGFFCTPGSTKPDPYPCGMVNYYCPVGTTVRYKVNEGFYSIPENVSDLYRTAQLPCPPGSYCIGGLKYDCPAGKYNSISNQVSCSSLCPRGFYCPQGSIYPIACPAGKYGSDIGMKTADCSGKCQPGFWCGDASISATQNACVSGRYGAEYGLQTEQCSPLCEIVSSELELKLDDDRILSKASNLVTSYGNGFNGTGTWPDEVNIGESYGITVDSRSQVVYIADTLNKRVIKIDKNDGNITTIGNGMNWRMPSGISFDSSTGDVYVTDTYNNTIIKIRADDGKLSKIGSYNISKKSIYNERSLTWKRPSGVAFDSASGNLFVADTSNNRIMLVSRNNDNPTVYGTRYNSGIFKNPIGVAYDSSTGNLYVGSYDEQQIYLISANDGPVYKYGPKIVTGNFRNELNPYNSSNVINTFKRTYGGPQGLAFDSTTGTLYFTFLDTLYSMNSNTTATIIYKSDKLYNLWDVDIDIKTKDIFVVSGAGVTKITLGEPTPNAKMISKHVPFCMVRYCSSGYYCPSSSTSDKQVECGGSNLYCPPGTSLPFTVDVGYYSVGILSKPGLMQVDDDVNIRSAQIQCELGYWCSNGVRYRCPKGFYGKDVGMTNSYCSGQCYAGFICDEASDSPTQRTCGINENDSSVYCPLGSFSPIKVPVGYYSISGTITTRASILKCEPGFFCVNGIKRSCPAGRYAAVSGSSSESCQGICKAGFYCPKNSTSSTQFPLPAGRYGVEGMESARGTGVCLGGYYCPQSSTSPTQFECGGDNLYCPPGSGAPLTIPSKYYSTGITIIINYYYC